MVGELYQLTVLRSFQEIATEATLLQLDLLVRAHRKDMEKETIDYFLRCSKQLHEMFDLLAKKITGDTQKSLEAMLSNENLTEEMKDLLKSIEALEEEKVAYLQKYKEMKKGDERIILG